MAAAGNGSTGMPSQLTSPSEADAVIRYTKSGLLSAEVCAANVHTRMHALTPTHPPVSCFHNLSAFYTKQCCT